MEGGLVSYNAIYTLETGASKKRKREKEVEEWNSKNGPVIIKKVENGKK